MCIRDRVTGLTNLTWVTAGFGWVTIVAPLMVAAPLYFGGKITFGGLMMAAAAFTPVSYTHLDVYKRQPIGVHTNGSRLHPAALGRAVL